MRKLDPETPISSDLTRHSLRGIADVDVEVNVCGAA